MDNQLDQKRALLLMCDRILEADDKTMEILWNTPICNKKMIERNAKNTKDPNPLSSMMSNINTKYPITIDTKKAQDFKVPSEFLYEEDTHVAGRRLCRLQAIEWFISNHSIKDESRERISNTLDVLLETHRKRVQNYYDYDWDKAQVTICPTVISRQTIRTNDVEVEATKAERNELVKVSLMPDFVLSRRGYDEDKLKKLQSLQSLSKMGALTLDSQLRLIMNQLDPRPRMVPILTGLSEKQNRQRHAFGSHNYLVMVDSKIESETEKIEDDEFRLLCMAASHCYITNGERLKVIDDLRNAKIRHRQVIDVAKRHNNTNNVYIKVALTLLGEETGNSSEHRGVTFYPRGDIVTQKISKTVKGISFCEYFGREKVYFTYDGISGSFVHDGPMLHSLFIEKKSNAQIRHILAVIAIYCKFDFCNSKLPSLNSIKTDIFKKVKQDPSEFLGINKKALRKIMAESSCPPVEFVEKAHSEQISLSLAKLNWKEARRCIEMVHNGNQTTEVFCPEPFPILPETIHGLNSILIDYYSPTKLLFKLVRYYMAQMPKIERLIRENNFNWRNKRIYSLIDQSVAMRVSHTARLLLGQDIPRPPAVTAFLYSMSFRAKGIFNVIPCDNFMWAESLQGDLNFNKGICHWDVNLGKVFICGFEIESSNIKDVPTLNLLLPGYTIERVEKKFYKFTSVLKLSLNPLREGQTAYIHIMGQCYKVTRDLESDYLINQTIQRGHIYSNLIEKPDDEEKLESEDDPSGLAEFVMEEDFEMDSEFL